MRSGAARGDSRGRVERFRRGEERTSGRWCWRKAATVLKILGKRTTAEPARGSLPPFSGTSLNWARLSCSSRWAKRS